MKKSFLLPVIAVLILGIGAPKTRLFADEVDLVKLKKQEEERQKKLKEQNKKTVVITNKTLSRYGEPAKTNDTKNKPDEQKKAEEPEKVDPIKTKEYWQKLKNGLETRIKELKEKLAENQLELNRLTTEHFIMDLPIEKQKIKEQKENMQQIVEGQKATLKKLQEEFDALPEKARQAGVPYGWIR
jgi:hypothetical protein